VKYSKYPSYKDSGIAWLGKVPTSYKYIRLKFLGQTFGGLSGKAGKDFNQENNADNKSFIPFTNIANNHYIQPNNLGTVTVASDEAQNQVKKNDLFFLMSSEGYEDLGKSSLLEFYMK
jgi:type I restriction enzyme S subunit